MVDDRGHVVGDHSAEHATEEHPLSIPRFDGHLR
jgi:hypothetical protein